MNKKIVSLLAAGVLTTTLGTTPAFAAAWTPSVCPVADCTLAENHQHNGEIYAAHFNDDGHDYHNNCGVSGCTVTGEHSSHSEYHRNGSHGHGNGHRSHNSGRHHR